MTDKLEYVASIYECVIKEFTIVSSSGLWVKSGSYRKRARFEPAVTLWPTVYQCGIQER